MGAGKSPAAVEGSGIWGYQLMLDAKVRYVSALNFNTEPEDFAELSRRMTQFLQRKGPAIKGLVETIVLGNEEKTQLLIVSMWISRESWSLAQWDTDVGREFTDLVQNTRSYEVKSFYPVAIVRMAAGE